MSDTDEMRKAGITYDETVAFAATGRLPFSYRARSLLRALAPAALIIAAALAIVLIGYYVLL